MTFNKRLLSFVGGAVAVWIVAPADSIAQLIVPAEVSQPVSALCVDYQPLYPRTQISDNGDSILTSYMSFANRVYAGYRSDYLLKPYTLIIYDKTWQPEPLPTGEACWSATANWLKAETGTLYWNKGSTCYSSEACKFAAGAGSRPKIIEPPLGPLPGQPDTSAASICQMLRWYASTDPNWANDSAFASAYLSCVLH